MILPPRVSQWLLRLAVYTSFFVIAPTAFAIESAISARQLSIADNAYAGSSVNVVAGAQTLFTDSVHQYAGFYNSAGQVVLAKRRLGEDHWQRKTTEFSGQVHDAHNFISLAVDRDGYLHLVWDQHNNGLNYAVSIAPGSLELERAAMLGTNENSVTYPQFIATPEGELLLFYRDGGSGNGNLLLNAYDTETRQWQRRQSNLISGEGERSAYWDITVDASNRLHMAWNWRETPDVATNHDIAYAYSDDAGRTWQRSNGEPYAVPITAASAEVVAPVEQGHNLMNPPRIAVDARGKAYIASYWSDTPQATPKFRIVRPAATGWQVFDGPSAGEAFRLQGWGTKRPPISRAALVVESDWEKSWPHLVYRDDTKQGRVLVASATDFDTPQWQIRTLTDINVGAFEPNIDPVQWRRLKHIQLLVQEVTQLDGNDADGASADARDVSLLIYKPDWERHQSKVAAGDTEAKPTQNIQPVFTPQSIKSVALRVADWQWANMPEGWHFHPQGWGVCPLYIGMLDIAPYLETVDLQARLLSRGRELNFAPRDNNPFDADDYCVSQAWLRLYQAGAGEQALTPSKAWLDNILANRPTHSLDWGNPHSRHRWSWSDSLFMGPMAWVLMWEITGEQAYLDFMNEEWWATTQRLYRSHIGLYFRDESYLDVREQNGKTVHWARGTSWVIAGLAQVLEHLPLEHPDYSRYRDLFVEMSAAFLQAQQADGLWRPGLLDPATHNARETSGSAFISFAFASGINQGVLEREQYLPAVWRTWGALVDSVEANGKLTQVQPVGAGPHGFDPTNAAPFASGALLMLAAELLEIQSEDNQ